MKKLIWFQNVENRLPPDLKSMAFVYDLLYINTTRKACSIRNNDIPNWLVLVCICNTDLFFPSKMKGFATTYCITTKKPLWF